MRRSSAFGRCKVCRLQHNGALIVLMTLMLLCNSWTQGGQEKSPLERLLRQLVCLALVFSQHICPPNAM